MAHFSAEAESNVYFAQQKRAGQEQYQKNKKRVALCLNRWFKQDELNEIEIKELAEDILQELCLDGYK